MAHKRKFDFDPTKSDSDDLDYGAQSSPRAKPQGRSRKSKTAPRKPVKRRRQGYGGSEDDIEDDEDDEISEEDSVGHHSEEDVPAEKNPRTGRSVRSAAKKPVKYEESEEELEAEDSDADLIKPTPARGKTKSAALKKPSLVLKLKVPVKMESGRATRARAGSSRPGSRREPTPQSGSAMGTRRSSRISHDEQAPLVELTDSGKHEHVARKSSATPEPPSARPTRGAKGLKKYPSAIMEASQEDQQIGIESTGNEDIISQLSQAAAGQTDPQAHHNSPGADEAVATGDEDAIQMEGVNEEEQVVQESVDDEEDEAPVVPTGRSLRTRRKASSPPPSQPASHTARRSLRRKKSGNEQSSDFEPEAEGEAEMEEDVSDSDEIPKSRGRSSNEESNDAVSGRRSGRLARKPTSQRSQSRRDKFIEEADELADEAADLEDDHQKKKRERKRPARHTEIAFETNLRNRSNRPDYRIMRPELYFNQDNDDAPPAPSPQRNKRGGGGGTIYRSLFSTLGPFGGAGGPAPVFGGQEGAAAAAGADSDSSDDEGGGVKGGPSNVGGAVGMTPTSAFPPKPFVPQTHNADPVQSHGGGPAGLGKVKDKKALADADPLGVDPNVSFDAVGGLENHINQLKEMVALPLLYPEVFQQFHITPPRGVLFHGPPGTGKTLLARALASSVSSQGKKVTFYMRKGADALSKWVGEAEKQLRLLFEEARKNQPSIIFFDEIDGLAPVRSSKQEQIHASIVATLLALMDGMDGRGQVIVIGATNRPDTVDPALRRPGRFDREFYFPLPDAKSRRSIIDIHTKGWDPPLQPPFKDQLSEMTKGYGGADLRALCTEAALNAVQGTFPQIYSSTEKLVIDPTKIKVLAKDFMISVNKIVPSSERSAASGAVPLRKDIEALLRKPLAEVSSLVDDAIPRKRKATALEEAMYDDRDDNTGFERENMARQFEAARVFRPRLLIRGGQGMGQQYLGAALLAKLEGLHVQNFDLATLLKDSTRSPEAAIVQQFEEVKRHKPSIIYIPNVDIWYRTLGESAIRTFTGLLRSLPPTDPVLVLGVLEVGLQDEDKEIREQNQKLEARMLRDLFPYSMKNQFELPRPDESARLEYFDAVLDYIRKPPSEFPAEENRKRRKLDELPVAQAMEESKGPTKEDLKAQKRRDRLTLNTLKMFIQRVMDQIKLKHKKFRTPVVEDRDIAYLYDEQNPNVLTTDLSEEQRQQQQLFRPYEIDKDPKGVYGLREVASGKFYYNLEIVTIEKRLSNGYYKRPKDFLGDIKRVAKDAKASGDQDRTLKANEMLANVEVDMADLEQGQPLLVQECEAVYHRDQEREWKHLHEAREAERSGEHVPKLNANVPPPGGSKTTSEATGPVVLGQEVPDSRPPLFPTTPRRLPGPGPMSNPWSTTNGSHPSLHTNGSTVPSRPHEDSEMTDSQYDHSSGPGQHPNHPNTQNTQGQLSQRSAHTRLAQGSQLDQYQNSASTTTSGQKTSDKSNRSSGVAFSNNTQHSSGESRAYPEFSLIPEAKGGSQLPDTQDPNSALSQASAPYSQSSQQMGPPAQPSTTTAHHRVNSIGAMLNHTADGTNPNNNDSGSVSAAQNSSANSADDAPAAHPTIILPDPTTLAGLHSQLGTHSSGLSVEQLEQVNAAMMEVIWQDRLNWNRNQVLVKVQEAFNEAVRDVEACQAIMKPSQED